MCSKRRILLYKSYYIGIGNDIQDFKESSEEQYFTNYFNQVFTICVVETNTGVHKIQSDKPLADSIWR